MLHLMHLPSPLGGLIAVASDTTLLVLEFEDVGCRVASSVAAVRRRFPDEKTAEASDPLRLGHVMRAYFDGDLAALDPVRVDPGGSPFQRCVWAMLRSVLAGSIVTYGTLARAMNVPGSSRAVGLANGRNPISIVVPCHRVIGSDGSLTGYGGGLWRKRWLLEHEGAMLGLG